jgi:hypothetical protein
VDGRMRKDGKNMIERVNGVREDDPSDGREHETGILNKRPHCSGY